MNAKIAKWFDEWRLAASGILLATRRWKFDLIVIIVFIVFGTLLNLLYKGFDEFGLLFNADLIGKLQILKNAFLGLFGINRTFWDWLPIFLIALLQGLLIGLVAFVWKKRKTAASNLGDAGIVTGLVVLSSGCPTCGTSILTPLIGAIAGGGSALVGTISLGLTIIAIIIALFSIKKTGLDTYAIIVSEKYERKKIKEKK